MAYEKYDFVDPVFLLDACDIETALSCIEDDSPENHFILTGKNLSSNVMNKLFKAYNECPEMLGFLNGHFQAIFHAQHKDKFVDNGFTFRKISMKPS